MTVIAAVTAGMALFLLAHVMIWRARPSNAPRFLLLGGLAVLGLTVSLAAAWWFSGDAVTLWAVAWIDSLCLVVYGVGYSGIARSVSLTLLGRLLEAGNTPLDINELTAQYVASSRFEDRITQLRRAGWLRTHNGSIALTPRGAALCRRARALSWFMAGELRG